MPFTVAELDNIANAALDFYIKGQPLSQQLQEKPLLAAMKGVQKTFPGGRQNISGNVKADYTTAFSGYSHDDSVVYGNPANIKQYSIPWYELHAGIAMTLSELKRDGISVVDSMNSAETTEHSDREMTAITKILEDKFEDMDEGTARSMNSMMWLDGTQSAKVFPGIQYFIADDPTTGVVEGIDRATNTWWRNRSLVGASKTTTSPTNQTGILALRKEVRQLRRYGGKPNLLLAGSTALALLEAEVYAKGYYTQTGFQGKTDISSPALTIKGLGDIMFDPTLDDIGRADYLYMIDTSHLYPYVMDGEDMKKHSPARPPEKYVLYRALTWTGALCCRKMNAHGVYQFA